MVVHFSSREELCCVVGTMQNFSKRSHRVGGGEEAADDRKQTNCVAEKRSLVDLLKRTGPSLAKGRGHHGLKEDGQLLSVPRSTLSLPLSLYLSLCLAT